MGGNEKKKVDSAESREEKRRSKSLIGNYCFLQNFKEICSSHKRFVWSTFNVCVCVSVCVSVGNLIKKFSSTFLSEKRENDSQAL